MTPKYIADMRLDPAEVWAKEPPLPDFVLPGLAVGTVGNVVAAGGTGKSYLMLASALGVSVGVDIGDLWGAAPKQGGAVYLGLEDAEHALRTRLYALRLMVAGEGRGRATRDLHVLACAGLGQAVVGTFAGGAPKPSDFFGGLTEFLKNVRPRLLVVDTLNRALAGLNENDAGVMGWALGQLEKLARDAGCAVVLCHHVSKASLVAATSGEAHAARGSSVITDNARWQCNMSIMAQREEGFEALADKERRRYVRLDFSKLNYGEPMQPRWLRRCEGGALRFGEPPRKAAPSPKVPATRIKAPVAQVA